MKIFEVHEQFEMEILQYLNSSRMLDSLVFAGGTMLRLCYNMNRYSGDLDFYFSEKAVKKADFETGKFFEKMLEILRRNYVITDSQDKFNTLLFELTHDRYPRRLKIEINKRKTFSEIKQVIAFSPFSTIQVLVNSLSLDRMMKNKVEALIDRREVRDAFDIEFLLRRGISFSGDSKVQKKVLKVIQGFSRKDYTVKLGSLLPADIREYYRASGFHFLEQHLTSLMNQT